MPNFFGTIRLGASDILRRSRERVGSFFAPSPDGVRARDVIREVYLQGKEDREELGRKLDKAFEDPNDPESVEVITEIALGFAPMGSVARGVKFAEKTIAKLAKQTSEKSVRKILSSMRVPDIVQDKYIKRITEETSERGVKRILDEVAENPIFRLAEAARASRPIRGEVELLQKQERAARFAVAERAQSSAKGQEGYFRALSKLKGELLETSPTFEPVKDSLKGKQIGQLYDTIVESPVLRFSDKLTAQRGLTKLLDGHPPVPSELKVMEEVFGTDVVRAIHDKRPLSKKIWDFAGEVLADIPRALKTTLDMSATFRQGIVLGIRNPVKFAKGFKTSFRSMISEDYFNKYLDSIKNTPEYLVANDAGLHISDPRKLFGNREEYFLSNLAEKLPFIGRLVKASNRGYVGMLNSLRFDVFNDLSQSLFAGRADMADLRALARFVNGGTGRGTLGSFERHAVAASKIFFAPRYVMSRVQFLNPFWYARMHRESPEVAKEALKTFGQYVGTVSTLITLAKMGGADVEIDPLSSDFGKMRVGNTRYDFTSGFGVYIRTFAQIFSGKRKQLSSGNIVELGGDSPIDQTRADVFFNVMRGKLAPLPGSIINLMEGRNVVGEEATIPSEVLDSVIPLYLQDINDVVKDRGWEGLLQIGIPAFFGVGTQTFDASGSRDASEGAPPFEGAPDVSAPPPTEAPQI